jgi:hypothetical protein
LVDGGSVGGIGAATSGALTGGSGDAAVVVSDVVESVVESDVVGVEDAGVERGGDSVGEVDALSESPLPQAASSAPASSVVSVGRIALIQELSAGPPARR